METSFLQLLCGDLQRVILELVLPELVPLPVDTIQKPLRFTRGDDYFTGVKEMNQRLRLAVAYQQIIRPQTEATVKSLLVSVWGPTVHFQVSDGKVAERLYHIEDSQSCIHNLFTYAGWGFLTQYVKYREALISQAFVSQYKKVQPDTTSRGSFPPHIEPQLELTSRLIDEEGRDYLIREMSPWVLFEDTVPDDTLVWLLRRGEIKIDIDDAVARNSQELIDFVQQDASFCEMNFVRTCCDQKRMDHLSRYLESTTFTTPSGFLHLVRSAKPFDLILLTSFESKIDYHVRDDELNYSTLLLHILGLMSYNEDRGKAYFEVVFQFLQKYWSQIAGRLVNPEDALYAALQLSLRRARLSKTIPGWLGEKTRFNPRLDVLLFLYEQLFQVPFDPVKVQAQLRRLTDTPFWDDLFPALAGWVQTAISQGQMKANPWLKKQGLC